MDSGAATSHQEGCMKAEANTTEAPLPPQSSSLVQDNIAGRNGNTAGRAKGIKHVQAIDRD
jgi:hypothetical protein